MSIMIFTGFIPIFETYCVYTQLYFVSGHSLSHYFDHYVSYSGIQWLIDKVNGSLLGICPKGNAVIVFTSSIFSIYTSFIWIFIRYINSDEDTLHLAQQFKQIMITKGLCFLPKIWWITSSVGQQLFAEYIVFLKYNRRDSGITYSVMLTLLFS